VAALVVPEHLLHRPGVVPRVHYRNGFEAGEVEVEGMSSSSSEELVFYFDIFGVSFRTEVLKDKSRAADAKGGNTT
jgi:hypothetical protein